jgi:alpha-tubulin suppressor-like RCC1 family protein
VNSAAFTVAPGAAAAVSIVSGDGQSGTVGTDLPDQLVVRVADTYGNAVSGATVDWSVEVGSGVLGAATSWTDVYGHTSVGYTLGTTPGTETIRGTAAGQSVDFTATATAAPEVTVQPDTVWVNVGHTQQMSATLAGSLSGPTWQSSDPEIASVDGTGLVTVHTAGVALITATIDGVSGNAEVKALAIDYFTNSPLATGASHSCVLEAGGTTQCWGSNDLGQLGDGTSVRRASPAPVATGAIFTSISGGGASTSGHSCGTTSSGAAYCWGGNGQGQLGIGYTSQVVNSPTQVAGALNFQSITTGNNHSCGLTSERIVHCWGAGRAVGDGTTSERSSPTAVSTNLRFRQISAGLGHTCGVTDEQEAYCWGANWGGQLGNGTANEALAPVLVTGGIAWASVSAGQGFTCGLTTGGAAYCWGSNLGGRLGDGTSNNRSTPWPVSGGNTYKALRAGGYNACAITTSGQPYCWGVRSFVRLLGPTTSLFDIALTPALVPLGGAAVEAIAVGEHHSCALTAGGVLCWGANEFGQVGQDPPGHTATPTQLLGGATFGSVTTSAGAHGCGLSGGSALCWGYNRTGQLGDNSTTDRTQPVAISGNPALQSITSGSEHTCALTPAGAAYCWGANTGGQLGNGGFFSSTAPVAVALGISFASISAGYAHTCGVENVTGVGYCWGMNGNGQLGDGTTAFRNTPVQVSGGITFTKISSSGYLHSCGLGRAPSDTEDKVYCWGTGSSTGNNSINVTPVLVTSPLSFTDIAAGARHTCAMTGSGTVYCWGDNLGGQLGDGSFSTRFSPTTPVPGTYQMVSAGDRHSCGLQAGGAAYCWGTNTYGQLGNGGSYSPSLVPVAVTGGISFTTISAGPNQTCGTSTTGAGYCWGLRGYGTLGDGYMAYNITPIQVPGLAGP